MTAALYRSAENSEIQQKTAAVSLFFAGPNHQTSRISAANEMCLAVNFRPEQRKQREIAIMPVHPGQAVLLARKSFAAILALRFH
jgi:hypothetical protein